jgi:hypothetical protein
VPVVPADELGSGVRPGQVLARNAQLVVGRRAERVDDRVVAVEQLVARDVLAEGDAAEEAEALLGGGLVVDLGDALELRVVGRDARADQAVRRRQGVIQVDLEACLEQLVGRVEAGRARSDDRGAVLGVSHLPQKIDVPEAGGGRCDNSESTIKRC